MDAEPRLAPHRFTPKIDEAPRYATPSGGPRHGESPKDLNEVARVARELRFEGLATRYPFLDPDQLRGYANAAKVRLAVHHSSPVAFEVSSWSCAETCTLQWTPINDVLRRSHNNADDAKRDGAYILAFAALEELEGLIGIARAETKTGADYYVAPRTEVPDDVEEALRLEVSGTDGSPGVVRSRMKEKKAQALRGQAVGPAIAAVVGFKSRLILVERA